MEERPCPSCGETWPAEHFTYSSGSPWWKPCNACWTERYSRVHGPCTVCGARVNTSRSAAHRGDPLVHRRCRSKDFEPMDEYTIRRIVRAELIARADLTYTDLASA
jgi:hypothetical protein